MLFSNVTIFGFGALFVLLLGPSALALHGYVGLVTHLPKNIFMELAFQAFNGTDQYSGGRFSVESFFPRSIVELQAYGMHILMSLLIRLLAFFIAHDCLFATSDTDR